MQGTHTEQMGLPLKRLGQLTMVSVPGLSRITEEELKDRVRVSETFLPLWPESGIRNQMASTGYCAGFVAPGKPLNPLAEDEITEEMKKGAVPGDAVHVLGSYLWMKIVEITPVISRDELEAMSYKLICKAGAVPQEEAGENSVPVPISQQVVSECKNIATERLTKKAGVKINFYDIILDQANELLICNTSSSLSLNRLLNKVRYVLTGRFSGDGFSVEDNDSEHGQDTVREVYEMTHVLQGGVDAAAVQESVSSEVLENDIKEYSRINNVWEELGLPPMEWPKNMTQLFNIAGPGIVLTQAFDDELADVIDAGYAIIDKGVETENSRVLTRLLEMYEEAEDASNNLGMVPALRRMNIAEVNGVGMTYPLGDTATGLFHSYNKKLLFDAVIHNTRFKSFEKFETGNSMLKSTLTIKSIEGEMAVGPYDVSVKFHTKGQTIGRVTPGTSDTEIIPMRPGTNMSDIVDRIENSVMICRELNRMFAELYRRMAEIYILAAGIKLIVDSESGTLE